MPRPEDSGGPPHPHHDGCFVLASGTLKPSPSATNSSRSCTSTSGCAVTPTAYRMLCLRFACLVRPSPRLRHKRKTRYGWVANPYPAGTFTQQDTPSFSWRDNDRTLKAFLSKVWEVYGGFSAIQLSNMTHEPNASWASTWGSGKPKNTDIEDDVIKDYFVRLTEGER